MRFEPAASEVKGKCANHLATEAPNVGVERVESAILRDILRKHSLTKTLRIGAWIKRFLDNSRVNVDNRQHGPLTTDEIDQQRLCMCKQR